MLGYHWKHPADFIKERPNGIHGMQLILIRSKARIGMGSNIYNVDNNTIFVVESCYPHALYGDGVEYIDDWIRFEVEDKDFDFLNSLGIERNVPIKLDTDIVSDMIKICVEIFDSDNPEKDETLRYLMNAVFMQIKNCSNPGNRRSYSQYENELEIIRRQIYEEPSADWKIPAIAKKLNMSVSHFQRLYKQQYGIPCTKDILTSRMEYAKQLLTTTQLSAIEVAEKCGYPDYAHFSKVFKIYSCESPSNFKKNKR